MTDTTNNQTPQPTSVGASRLQALRLSLSERPVITADEAFLLLHIDRSTGYKAIKEGTFPVPVLRRRAAHPHPNDGFGTTARANR